MIFTKKLKKKLKSFIPLAIIGALCLAMAIKSVHFAIGTWQHSIQPLLRPTLVECKTHSIFSQEFARDIQTIVQEYSMNQLIVSFDSQELYKKIKERCKTVTSLTYELQAPREVSITICGTAPKMVINDSFVLGNGRRLFLKSDFQDFNLKSLPHLSIERSLCGEKLSAQAYEFVSKVPAAMCDQFTIIFTAPEYITLIPNQTACPFKIVADNKTVFDESNYKQINRVFNDLVKKEQITQRMLASKECSVVFDIRFDNRVYVKFLNKSRRGGRW